MFKDVDGDMILDIIIIGSSTFYPPVQISSKEYMMRETDSLKKGTPDFKIELKQGNPWFRFKKIESDASKKEEKPYIIDAYPFQEKFNFVVGYALKSLKVRQSTEK